MFFVDFYSVFSIHACSATYSIAFGVYAACLSLRECLENDFVPLQEGLQEALMP